MSVALRSMNVDQNQRLSITMNSIFVELIISIDVIPCKKESSAHTPFSALMPKHLGNCKLKPSYMEPDDVTKLCSITNRTPVLPMGWRLKDGIASSSFAGAEVALAA